MSELVQLHYHRNFQKRTSAICLVALLGFAILFNNVAAMNEGDNQREQDKGLAAPNPVP